MPILEDIDEEEDEVPAVDILTVNPDKDKEAIVKAVLKEIVRHNLESYILLKVNT